MDTLSDGVSRIIGFGGGIRGTNPCANWPRRRFYIPWRDQTIQAPYAFIPSTAADNPYISDAQREGWKEMPENEYRRFVKGDWEALTSAYYDMLNPQVHLINRTA